MERKKKKVSFFVWLSSATVLLYVSDINSYEFFSLSFFSPRVEAKRHRKARNNNSNKERKRKSI